MAALIPKIDLSCTESQMLSILIETFYLKLIEYSAQTGLGGKKKKEGRG